MIRAHLVRSLRSKGFLILAGLSIFSLLLAVGAGLTATIVVEPETEYNAAGVTGHVTLKGGVDGQGLRYVTSGEPGFKSQSITVAGTIRGSDTLGYHMCQYQYRVFVNAGEYTETPPTQNQAGIVSGGTGDSPLAPYVFTFDGHWEGALRVELWGYLATGLHRLAGGCDTWFKLGSDGAELVDGRGSVGVTPGQSDRFQDGDSVKLDVQSGEGHWILEVFDGRGTLACGLVQGGGGFLDTLSFLRPARFFEGESWEFTQTSDATLSDGSPLVSTSTDPSVSSLPSGGSSAPTSDPNCKASLQWNGQRSATVRFQVPQGAFVKGGNNVWRVTLRNTLIEHSTDQFVVLDQKILAPEPPIVSVSDATPSVGDSITYTMSARQNLASSEPIDHFIVYAWYGTENVLPTATSSAWIARGISTPAIGDGAYTFTGDYSFVVHNASQIRARVYAVDTDGRASGATLSGADAKELKTAAYTPPPNSTASNSGTYQKDPNTDGTPPPVNPKGSEPPATPPAPAQNKGLDRSVFLLAGLVLAVSALAWTALQRQAPAARLAAVVIVLTLGIVLGFVWIQGG